MEKRTKLRLGLLLSTFVCVPSAQAIISSLDAAGLVTNGTMKVGITGSVLDKKTGDFYVGTGAGPGSGALALMGATCSIAKFSVPTGSVITGTAISSAAVNDAVSAMAVSNLTALRFAWSNSAGTNIDFINVTDGITTGTMLAAVTDAAGAVGGDIKGLAVNDTHAFSLVSANGAAFLANNTASGLNSHALNATTLVPAAAASTTVFSLASGVANGLGLGIAVTAINPTATPKMVYDPIFDKIYVGISCTSGALNTNGARSLIIVNNTAGALAGVAINGSADTAWADFAGTGTSNIVGVLNTATNPAANILKVNFIDIMHTSTGLSYLILNGGIAATDIKNNRVWALPLVTKGFTNEGTFADTTSPMFNTQAASAITMYTETSIPAIVGNSAAPWQNVVGSVPSDMHVVGDTVYISSATNLANTDESGILYSQAIFGAEGKIVRWTRWEKAVPTGMGTNAADGSINSFGVDARSGRIWSVPEDDGTAARIVRISSWANSTVATTLQGAVAAALPEGVFSMYNLGRSSFNFGAESQGRYTLFGGQGKVVITRTDIADADPNGTYIVPQTVPPTDFSLDANFLSTTLPAGAGVVQCLGFSHWTTVATPHFFFAGTNAGLYAYAVTAAPGVGLNFDNGPANALNAVPFTANPMSWQQITGITGAVRKIKSNGLCLYVLARDNNGGTVTDTLYRITEAANVTAIINTVVTVATSGSGSLVDAATIEDFEIVQWGVLPSATATVAAVPTQEQVILATGNGLYESRALLGLNAAGNNTPALAVWTKIVSEEVYTRLFAQNRLENVLGITGVYLRDDADGKGTYTSSFLDHLLAQGPNIMRDPEHYTSNGTSIIYPDKITSYWSDGARRLFVTSPSDGSYALKAQSMPYKTDSLNFNVTAPIDQVNDIEGKTVYAIGQLPNGFLCACLGPDGIVIG